jgi:hypothetical protein
LRHVPLASWTRARLEPLRQARALARISLEPQRAATRIAARNGSCLRLTRCAPPAFASPLLAADCIARGKTLPATIEANSIARRTSTRLPLFLGSQRAGLAPATSGIWKINSSSPWNVAQPLQAEAVVPASARAVLPELGTSPVRPGLAAISDLRRFEARPVAMPAGDVRWAPAQAEPAPPALAEPVLPPLNLSPVRPGLAAESDVHQMAASPLEVLTPPAVQALPSAFRKGGTKIADTFQHTGGAGVFSCVSSPLLFQSDAVRPQDVPVSASFGDGTPLAPQLRVAFPSSMDAAALRPDVAGTVTPLISGSLPRAGAPRCPMGLALHQPRTALAIPAGTTVGFTMRPLAAVGPEPIAQTLRPLASEPDVLPITHPSMPALEVPITRASLGDRPGVVPLDVYVQRIRSTPRRECQWRPDVTIRVIPPVAMPGVWPARFEQLVLQDWRRRYPARQMSAAPAPLGGAARVLPMTRHLTAVARLRQNAPFFAKGLAAAAFVGAILWFSFSTETVRTTVAADRTWLRDTISNRATKVHDDNFHSGLNLWDGRKNWAQSWSYSQDGFMRTGQLALYRPTLGMENYKLEFFAQIESKSMGWVFRARDEQNYYAMKLSVTEPGPRPLVSVVRYPVLNGKKGKRVQIPLPIMMHNNTPYHVALDVKGTRFRAFLENQEIDSWTDDRLKKGGVGFFSESGEHARLYWVKVSNNTDWLGRLCGMLSGSGTQDSADLWNPQPSGTVAMLDPGSILEGAKNVDRKRGVSTLPIATGNARSFAVSLV